MTARAPSFRATARAGTPHEMETKVCTTPASAKTFIRGRIQARKKWAERYNLGTADRLNAILVEFDSLDIKTLPLKEERSWSARDDYSKVEFVFTVEVTAR